MKPVPVIIPSKFPKIVSNFIPLSDQIPKLPFVRPFVPFSLPSLSFSLVHRSPFSHPNAIFLCMRRQLQRGENSFKRAIHFHENLPFSALCEKKPGKIFAPTHRCKAQLLLHPHQQSLVMFLIPWSALLLPPLTSDYT